MQIKFLDFSYMHLPIRKLMLDKFSECYDSNAYVLGTNVAAFEKAYAAFCSTRYCIGVANGLDALVLCLQALDISRGDEVIVPSNTYIATWLAVSRVGARPIPVEPHLQTYNINCVLIAEAITKRTKAILPVHLYGQPADMEPLLNLANKCGLPVVEDNAQAQGATYKGQRTGSFGLVNATSFYPGKNLGALGDGGAVTTQSESLALRIASLRNYGFNAKNYAEEKGINSRLDEIQAGFLSVKLGCIDTWNRERAEISRKYNERLKGTGDVIVPQELSDVVSVHHQYVVRSNQRDALQGFLGKNRIETLIHYPVPPHLQKAYADLGFSRGSFPLAEEIANTCLSLPIYPGLDDSSIDFVAEKIRLFFNH